MDGLGDYIHCSYNSSTLERPAAAFKENKPSAHWTESCKSYTVLSTASRHAPPPFDCGFGRSYFGWTLSDSHAFQQGALTSSTSVSGDSVKQNMPFSGLISHNLHCSAITSRIKDLRVYEGYTDSYSRNPRYIDIPVVGRDPMHDILPMDDPTPRDWPVCSNSVYHYRDQSQSSQLWIPSIPGIMLQLLNVNMMLSSGEKDICVKRHVARLEKKSSVIGHLEKPIRCR